MSKKIKPEIHTWRVIPAEHAGIGFVISLIQDEPEVFGLSLTTVVVHE
jgi:hypothetical protein